MPKFHLKLSLDGDSMRDALLQQGISAVFRALASQIQRSCPLK